MRAGPPDKALERLIVLIADSNLHSRRLTRMMLANAGARVGYEVSDGSAALNAIRELNPDVMILDWDLPGLSAPDIMRIVRSPGSFPKANLPIIVLTDCAKRARVDLALQLGVHEFLVKPTSPKTLQQRLISITNNPRPMVLAGDYYVPLPRKRADREELLSEPPETDLASLGDSRFWQE
jgi:two-component system, chemotaxis family, chemotaxis protein CheY